jgi:hypothetical protein
MNVEKKTIYNRWLTPQKKQKLITSKNSRFYLTKAGGLKLAELMPEKAQEVEAITAKGGWETGKPGNREKRADDATNHLPQLTNHPAPGRELTGTELGTTFP